MKILITGASGIIGTQVSSFLSDNYDLSLLYNNNKIESKNAKKLDLCDLSSVENFAKNCSYYDVLIFFSGLAHKRIFRNRRKVYFEQNYYTIVRLLSLLEKNNKLPRKIIFASTISVYGERMNIQYFDEAIKPLPRNYYAKSKYKAEKHLIDKYKSISWILRFAPVYSKDFKLNIERRSKLFGFNFLVGKGLKQISLCNINNIKLVIAAVIKNKVSNGVYNISDNRKYLFKDLLKYRNIDDYLAIPESFIYSLYKYNKLLNINFINENCIKLISNMIYPSDKINKYIKLDNYLFDSKN